MTNNTKTFLKMLIGMIILMLTLITGVWFGINHITKDVLQPELFVMACAVFSMLVFGTPLLLIIHKIFKIKE